MGILFHGTSAPALMLRPLSGITRSGSITSWVPRPVQVGQAPWGELKENERGSRSSIADAVVRAGEALAEAALLELGRLAVTRTAR